MGKIISLEESIPHKVSEVICINCLKRWMAVRNKNILLKKIQCPYCNKIGFVIETGEILEENK